MKRLIDINWIRLDDLHHTDVKTLTSVKYSKLISPKLDVMASFSGTSSCINKMHFQNDDIKFVTSGPQKK